MIDENVEDSHALLDPNGQPFADFLPRLATVFLAQNTSAARLVH
jgi:hypothetical protein